MGRFEVSSSKLNTATAANLTHFTWLDASRLLLIQFEGGIGIYLQTVTRDGKAEFDVPVSVGLPSGIGLDARGVW